MKYSFRWSKIPKVSRNAPCPCGSGKKYKNCCLTTDRNKKFTQNVLEKEIQETFNSIITNKKRCDTFNQALDYLRTKSNLNTALQIFSSLKWKLFEILTLESLGNHAYISRNYEEGFLKFKMALNEVSSLTEQEWDAYIAKTPIYMNFFPSWMEIPWDPSYSYIKGIILFNLGEISLRSHNSQAFSYLHEAETIFRKIQFNNNANTLILGLTQNNLSKFFSERKKYDLALEFTTKASINLTLGFVPQEIRISYAKTFNDYQNGLITKEEGDYILESMINSTPELLGDRYKRMVNIPYSSKGKILILQGKYEEGLRILELAIKTSREVNDFKEESNILLYLANYYIKINDFETAIELELDVLKYYKQQGYVFEELDLLLKIGENYYKTNQFNQSFQILYQALLQIQIILQSFNDKTKIIFYDKQLKFFPKLFEEILDMISCQELYISVEKFKDLTAITEIIYNYIQKPEHINKFSKLFEIDKFRVLYLNFDVKLKNRYQKLQKQFDELQYRITKEKSIETYYNKNISTNLGIIDDIEPKKTFLKEILGKDLYFRLDIDSQNELALFYYLKESHNPNIRNLAIFLMCKTVERILQMSFFKVIQELIHSQKISTEVKVIDENTLTNKQRKNYYRIIDEINLYKKVGKGNHQLTLGSFIQLLGRLKSSNKYRIWTEFFNDTNHFLLKIVSQENLDFIIKFLQNKDDMLGIGEMHSFAQLRNFLTHPQSFNQNKIVIPEEMLKTLENYVIIGSNSIISILLLSG